MDISSPCYVANLINQDRLILKRRKLVIEGLCGSDSKVVDQW